MEIGIFGRRGSGKSTVAILLARNIQKMAKREYGIDIIIYTNMDASGNGVQVIKDLGEIPFDRTPKVLIIDEAMFSMDSRASSSKTNQLWTQAAALFRKVNFLAVLYCTHNYGMIDTRLRNEMHYLIMARKTVDRFEYMVLDTVSYQSKFMFLKREKEIFDYCDFNTDDFPFPIRVDLLLQKVPQIALYK